MRLFSAAAFFLLVGFLVVEVKTQQRGLIELCTDEFLVFEGDQLNVCICVVLLTGGTGEFSIDKNITITLNYAGKNIERVAYYIFEA